MTTNVSQPRVNENCGDGAPATVDTDTDLNTCSSENKVAENEDLTCFVLSNHHATSLNQRAPGFSTEEVEDVFNLSSKSQFRPPDTPDSRPASSVGKHHPSRDREKSPRDQHEETVVLFSDEILSNSTDVPGTWVEPVTHSIFIADSTALLPKDTATSPSTGVPHWSISFSESETLAPSVGDALWKFKCDGHLPSPVSQQLPALPATDETFFLNDVLLSSHSALETANNPKQRIGETGEPAKCSGPAWSPRSLSQESQRIEISLSDLLKTPQCVADQKGNRDMATWTEIVPESHPISTFASSIAVKASSPKEAVDSQVVTLTPAKLADSATATKGFSEVHLESSESPLALTPIETKTRVNPTSLMQIYDVNNEVSQLFVSMSLANSTIGRRNVNAILPTSKKAAASNRSRTTGPLPSTERPALMEASERLKLTNKQQRVINSLLLSSRKKVPSVQPTAHSSGLAPEKSLHSAEQSPPYRRDNSPTPEPAEVAESARSSSKSSQEAARKPSRSISDTGPTSREKSTSKARILRKGRDRAEPRPRKQSQSNKPGSFDETKTKFGSPDAKTQHKEVKTDSKASKQEARNSRARKERGKDCAPNSTDGRSLNWLLTQLTGPKSDHFRKQSLSTRDRARSAFDVQPKCKTSGASEPQRHVSNEIPPNKREKRQQSVSKPAPVVPSHLSEEELPNLRNLASASNEAVPASKRKRLHSSKPEPTSTASSVLKLSADKDKASAQRSADKENLRQSRNPSKDTEKISCFIGVSKRTWSAPRDPPISSFSNSKPTTETLPPAPTHDVSITPPGLRRAVPLAMPPTVYLELTSDSESLKNWQPPPAASCLEKPADPAMDDSRLCLPQLGSQQRDCFVAHPPTPLLAQSDVVIDPKLFDLMELMTLSRKTHRTVGMTNPEATKATDSNSQHQAAEQGLDRSRQLVQALQRKSLLLLLQHRGLRQLPPQTRARLEPASTATHPSFAAQEWRSA